MMKDELEKAIGQLLKELRQFEQNVLKKKASAIFIQVPEGLKTRALEIVAVMENHGYEVILSSDPCWGACDLRTKEAEMTGADLIIHIGHKKFIKNIESKIPVMYFLWKYKINLNRKKIEKELMKIRESRIGIVSSVQYEDYLPDIAGMLKELGKQAEIGGYVLGCWTENAKLDADALLFVGSGQFHPIGAKCKYQLDMEKLQLNVMENSIMLQEKKRFARIEKARDAKIFAILISSKPGQFELEKARQIKKRLEEKDKKAFMLIMDEITDAKLLGIRADAFINTACPRIRDDYFQKPVINPEDVDFLI